MSSQHYCDRKKNCDAIVPERHSKKQESQSRDSIRDSSTETHFESDSSRRTEYTPKTHSNPNAQILNIIASY